MNVQRSWQIPVTPERSPGGTQCLSFTGASVGERLAALFDGGRSTTLDTRSALSLSRGEIAGRRVIVAATDPHIEKGVLGVAECADLHAAVRLARDDRLPLLLLIDSAGARLNDGLPIQGALRRLMTELLDAGLDGLPILAMLGRHAFGGASMLAFAAGRRCYAPSTLLAMSGPRVIQAASGAHLHAVTQAIAGSMRAHSGGSERLLDDSLSAYASAAREWLQEVSGGSAAAASLEHERGILTLRVAEHRLVPVCAIDADRTAGRLICRGGALVGAADVLRLATLVDEVSGDLLLSLDCAGHSTRLDDERQTLTQYLVHLAKTLRRRVRAGNSVRLAIAGDISGGIYIAAAGAASSVGIERGGSVRTLPQSALDHILSQPAAASDDFSRYAEFGVADILSFSY